MSSRLTEPYLQAVAGWFHDVFRAQAMLIFSMIIVVMVHLGFLAGSINERCEKERRLVTNGNTIAHSVSLPLHAIGETQNEHVLSVQA